MTEKIESIKAEAAKDKDTINDVKSLEEYRLKYLSRKGLLSELFEGFKTVEKEKKGETGKALNILKNFIQGAYDEKKAQFETGGEEEKQDYTLPGRKFNEGSIHLVSQAIEELTEIFKKIGFSVYEGLEIEDEFHNFDALNTPSWHPSRDMQDTFYIKGTGEKNVLRTHTSPGQIRVMEKFKPPIRIIVPGKAYRNEEISARSLAMFHQIEGLYVDKNVTMRELKGTLNYFAKEFFGKDVSLRLRPSYFPFTEPSAEMDVKCYLCKGQGCRICKYTGWLEIGGCGMVDPEVFKAVGYDPEEYSGFAFGFGIERQLLIKYDIPDIRLLYENDIRFLKQFK